MTSSPRTVLILGANGRLGLAAAQAFAAAGWSVLAQARRPLVAGMPASARRLDLAISGKSTDIDALARAAAGASVLVYGVNPLYTRWNEEALPLARAGMDLAQRLGATFMLPGNVYNFGASMPALLTENTPERPSNDKGTLRATMEAEMAARAGQGLRSIVVRAGDFYGGGPGSWMDLLLLKSLPAGKLVYPGPLDVPHAWAYLPDLARCFVALAGKADLPLASRFHFPGHTLTGVQLLAAIERAAQAVGAPGAQSGRPLRRSVMSWLPLRLLAWAVPMWRELLKMSYLWRVPHALDGSLLRAALGTVPETPVDAALRQTLQDLGLAAPAPREQPATAT
jgi:nucleoside-diphosphate-sugar epimerase